MKTKLVICHLEPDFKPNINLVNKVVNYSRLFPNWNDVIVIESASELSNTKPFEEMADLYNSKQVETWIWGGPDYFQSEDCKLEYGKDYICFDGGHESAYIYDWMRQLNKNFKYLLVGGGRYECLYDVHKIFEHLGLNCQIIESLTY